MPYTVPVAAQTGASRKVIDAVSGILADSNNLTKNPETAYSALHLSLQPKEYCVTKKLSKKEAALKQQMCLNAQPEQVTDPLFEDHEFFDPRDQLQVKYEMLRRVRADGYSVSSAALQFGFSRPAFYQAQQAFEQKGLSGLLPKKPGPKNAHKLNEDVMAYINEVFKKEGSKNASELTEMIAEHFGLKVHPRSIERALQRARKKNGER
jgi:transposase